MSIVQSGLEGLARAQAALEKTAGRVASLPLSSGGPSEDVVDISAEAVALMVARNAFQANLKVIETGDQLDQSTLDVLG
ncbi:MAG: flagellar basal body rod C-terminal domain-containing protein [Bryobacteraceae bacterium]|nr:flagellar basal body rod C-terminal domain-containing protein [Bryobacteraceae bacterium]